MQTVGSRITTAAIDRAKRFDEIFNIKEVYKGLTASKCKPDDNRELDTIEFYKLMGFFFTQLNATANFGPSSAVINPWSPMSFYHRLDNTPILSGHIAVEIFYLLSCFLVAHQCFKLLKRENKRFLSVGDILNVYWRKFTRLAPLYYAFLFIGWTSCQMYSKGPLWGLENGDWFDCSTRWWKQMLFIGNLVDFQYPNTGCYAWTWAIECDMQLTLLVPLIVQVFRLSEKLGYYSMVVLWLASIGINSYITVHYGFRAGGITLEAY